MGKKDYIIKIDNTIRIFVYCETMKGKVIRFVVKLEILVGTDWIEIERYDNYHGYVHKDIHGKDQKKKQIIKYELVNNESGLNMAIEDFRKNYQLYIWRYQNG